MDQFLDDHQQIDKELTAKPSLINDQKYLAQHQDLKLFLSQHPQVREEFTENPTNFMQRERRFDAREDFRSARLTGTRIPTEIRTAIETLQAAIRIATATRTGRTRIRT